MAYFDELAIKKATKLRWSQKLRLLFVRKQYQKDIDGFTTTRLTYKMLGEKIYVLKIEHEKLN